MEELPHFNKTITDTTPAYSDIALVQCVKQYFNILRQMRGHNPEGSPIDLEILLILKLILFSVENPIQMLHNMGIVVVNDEIAINANFLKVYLSTCRSRINNSLKNLGWNIAHHQNQEKYDLLHPLVDRKDVRNWSLRIIPPDSPVLQFIHENPNVQLKLPATNDVDQQLIQIPALSLDSNHQVDDHSVKDEQPSYP